MPSMDREPFPFALETCRSMGAFIGVCGGGGGGDSFAREGRSFVGIGHSVGWDFAGGTSGKSQDFKGEDWGAR